MTIFDGTAAGGTAEALAALQAQFAGQAGDNPNLALLMQLFEQRQQAAAATAGPDAGAGAEPPEPAPEPLPEPTPTLDAATSADLRLLLDRSAAIEAEVEALRERNDALAAALGACHLCFGADDWCRHCGGRGTPGSLRPDRKAFDHYVRPALQRLARPAKAAPPRPAARAAADFGRVAGTAPESGGPPRPPAG